MGWEWAWAWACGCRVTLLARCEVLARAAWYSRRHVPSATRHTQTASSRPCFARDAANGASTDTQELSVSSMGALRHGGRWESGHVRVGIGMRCIPACATTPASQGPRHGSVPGRGSNWINAILVPLAHACGCTSPCAHWGREHASPMRNWPRARGSAGLFMTLPATVPPAAPPGSSGAVLYIHVYGQ